MKILKWVFLSIHFSVFLFLYSESFYFPSLSFFSINNSSVKETQCSLNLDDGLLIRVEEHNPFFAGLDIEISQSHARAISLFLYSVSTLHNETEKKYMGRELFREELQQKKNFTFRLLYDEKIKLQGDATIRFLPFYLNEPNSAIILKLSQNEKQNVGDEEKKLTLRLRPILQDVGGIKFNLIYPEPCNSFRSTTAHDEGTHKNITVRVDNAYVKDISKPYMTSVGQHKIQVDSNFYKSEVISCLIEKGKIETIDVELKSLDPVFTIEGPNSLEVYLDNKPIKLPFCAKVEVGEHLIRCKMDGYELVRSLTAEAGKNYVLNLLLSLIVSEN